MNKERILFTCGFMAAIIFIVLLTVSVASIADEAYVESRDTAQAVYKTIISNELSSYAVTRIKYMDIIETTPLPDHINVKYGDNIKLLISNDFECKLYIGGYGISANIYKDSVTEIEFIADKIGNYKYYCRGSYPYLSQAGLLEVS